MASIGLAHPATLRRRVALRLTADRMLLAAVAAVIVYLVLTPIAFLLISSFRRYELLGSISYVFTLANYRDAYLTEDFLEAFRNSVVYGVGGMAVALAIGTALAWVVERTNAPLRTLITLGAAATYLIPGTLITLAWVALANARIGSFNHLIRLVLPVEGPPLSEGTPPSSDDAS